MSAIIRTHTTVVSWPDIAVVVASAGSPEQREFLELLSNAIETGMPRATWAFQCRYITDDHGWDEDNRRRLIWQLETLLEHLKDPAPKTAA